jgi:hypothetical protein
MPDKIDELLANEEVEKPYNSADPEDVNKARVKAGRRRYSKLNAVRRIMSDKDQRRYVYGILLAGEPLRLSYLTGEPQPGGNAFRDGKKFIAFQLIADIRDACPELFDLMIQEAVASKQESLYPTIGFDR